MLKFKINKSYTIVERNLTVTRDLGKINAVRDMMGEIKHKCQAYMLCKQLTGLTNQTMEDLVAFWQHLEKKLEDLEKQ